jgi:hypothetical protein
MTFWTVIQDDKIIPVLIKLTWKIFNRKFYTLDYNGNWINSFTWYERWVPELSKAFMIFSLFSIYSKAFLSNFSKNGKLLKSLFNNFNNNHNDVRSDSRISVIICEVNFLKSFSEHILNLTPGSSFSVRWFVWYWEIAYSSRLLYHIN